MINNAWFDVYCFKFQNRNNPLTSLLLQSRLLQNLITVLEEELDVFHYTRLLLPSI